MLPYTSYKPELNRLAKGGQYVFDCELMGKDFTETMEQGRRQKDRDESNLVLNVFDAFPLRSWLTEDTGDYTARKLFLRSLFNKTKPDKVQHLDYQSCCQDDADVQLQHDICVMRGFEGVMLKADTPYEWSHKDRRSSNLRKLKRRDRFIRDIERDFRDIIIPSIALRSAEAVENSTVSGVSTVTAA